MKRSNSNALPVTLSTLILVCWVHAASASLILYDFAGNNNAQRTASKDTDPNSTASSYSANASLGTVSSGTRSHFARASLFPSTNTLTTLSDFSVSANPGYVLDLDSLDFSYGVTGVTDARTFQFLVYTDVDSYTTAIASLEDRLCQLQQQWSQTQLKIEAVMQRAQTTVDDGRLVLGHDDDPPRAA